MVERAQPLAKSGYLRLKGQGGCTAEEMTELLLALNASYQAIARVELAAYEAVLAMRSIEAYEPPFRYPLPTWMLAPRLPSDVSPAEHLIVHRVVLQSPGFWEFLGTLNPLEVLRKYLNDRHERRKDREYREGAERRQLEIENALGELRVMREVAELERRYGRGSIPPGIKQRIWAAEIKQPLEQLASFDERGLIDGGSAASGSQLPEENERDAES